MVKEKEELTVETELQEISKQISKLNKKHTKSVLSGIIAFLLALIIGLGVGGFVGNNWDAVQYQLHPETKSKETVTILQEKLKDEAKLNTGIYKATAKYSSGDMTKAFPLSFKNDDNSIFKKAYNKITKKSFSFTFSGTVEAGISDLSKAKVEANSKTNTITVTLPAIEITNVNIDYSSISAEKQTKNILNQITIQDYTNAQKTMKKQLVSAAKKNNITQKAQESAEQTLSAMFKGCTDDYKVEFVWKK